MLKCKYRNKDSKLTKDLGREELIKKKVGRTLRPKKLINFFTTLE